MSQKTGFYWLMDQHSFKRYNVFPIPYFRNVRQSGRWIAHCKIGKVTAVLDKGLA